MTGLKHKVAGFLIGVLVATGIVSAQTGIMSTTTGVVYVRGISGVTLTNSTFTGQSKFADGSAAAPSITFASDTNKGLYNPGGTSLNVVDGGNILFTFSQSGNFSNSSLPFGWSDVLFYRDAPNTAALRNGTDGQKFNIHRTYTDAANYERLEVDFSGPNGVLRTAAAGTGIQRELMLDGPAVNFAAGGTTRWYYSTTGHWLANADNTYDIGASGASRPRTGYFGTHVVVGSDVILSAAGSTVQWVSRGGIQMPSDGVAVLYDTAFTSFGRLSFGGTTSSFPAWKRNGANLEARLADDSASTQVIASYLHATGGTTYLNATGTLQVASGAGSPEGVLTAVVGSLYLRTDGGASTTLYVKESGTGNTGWVAK